MEVKEAISGSKSETRNELLEKMGVGRLGKLVENLEKAQSLSKQSHDGDPINEAMANLSKAEVIKALKDGDKSPLEVLAGSGISIKDIMDRAETRAREAEGARAEAEDKYIETRFATIEGQIGSLAGSIHELVEALKNGGGGGYNKDLSEIVVTWIKSRMTESPEKSPEVADLKTRLETIAAKFEKPEQTSTERKSIKDEILEAFELVETIKGKAGGEKPGVVGLDEMALRLHQQELEDSREKLKITNERSIQQQRVDVLKGVKQIVEENITDMVAAARDVAAEFRAARGASAPALQRESQPQPGSSSAEAQGVMIRCQSCQQEFAVAHLPDSGLVCPFCRTELEVVTQ